MDQISPEQLAILAQENEGPKLVGVAVTFTVFALICVILRFFTRIKFIQHVGWEDYTIALSMFFSVIVAVCQVGEVKYGSGKHAMFVDLVSAVKSLRYLYFSILAYCISLTLTKISILLQYRSILSVRARLPIYIVMGICVAYGIETSLTGTFTCVPVDAFWDLMKRPTAKCLNENALYYANAGLNVGIDLLVATLPVRALWRLQIVMKQKIALLIILTLGWFVCIVSVIRLNALIAVARNPQDSTWYGAAAAYWSSIEMNLTIVCASTPALKPLVVRIIPTFSSQGSNESSERFGASRQSGLSRSFQRLRGKQSSATINNTDVEEGTVGTGPSPITALPPWPHQRPNHGHIYVTRDFDQKSDRRLSDSSQRLDSATQYALLPIGKG